MILTIQISVTMILIKDTHIFPVTAIHMYAHTYTAIYVWKIANEIWVSAIRHEGYFDKLKTYTILLLACSILNN